MPKLKNHGNSMTLRHRRRLIREQIKSLDNINLNVTSITSTTADIYSIPAASHSTLVIDDSFCPQNEWTEIESSGLASDVPEEESDSLNTYTIRDIGVSESSLPTNNSVINLTTTEDEFIALNTIVGNRALLSENNFPANSNVMIHTPWVENSNSDVDLKNELRDWAIVNSICRTHLRSLLNILRQHGHNLPADPRTLLKTARNTELTPMSSGMYYHFGLETGLHRSVQRYYPPENYPSEIKLNINVDGLPLTKSSASQFWPILAAIQTDFHTEPFIVGVYHGYQKPEDSNEFLKYFTEEFSDISKTGLIIESKKITVNINAFICDAPAKAFVTCTKGHNAYFGCGKCSQEGEYVEHRVTFPEMNAPLRTDESFRLRLNEEHHKKRSILETLEIGMVSQFPLDSLHLGDLGATKKLGQFYVKGRHGVRMTKFHLDRCSDHLLSLTRSIPKEFARKPRPLEDIDRFKGTGLRQLLLYTGPVVFKNNLTVEKYQHFLSLSVAFRILSSADTCIKLNEYARTLLRYFVENYPLLYGYQHMSYNVHNLIHLCNDVKLYGPLEQFSAFKFENHMSKIKKKVKTSSRPLQQLVNRSKEEYQVPVTHEKIAYPFIKYSGKDMAGNKRKIKSIHWTYSRKMVLYI